MKKFFIIPLLLIAAIPAARSQCTSIMVGRNASFDGSVITSHNCDSDYRTWMRMVPAADHEPGSMETIYSGRMHTITALDSTGMHVKGRIPQAAHTYRFLDTAYPALNEKQLAIGETTVTGRDTLRNPAGMFMIEELERVALERCTTAREAIALIGDLVKTYGYGDSGECITIADKQEVWMLEIFGEGPGHIGGVWAAIRIPDDEVGVSANITRIGKIDIRDKDRCLASDNVFSVARDLGLWDGKQPFSFWKAYGGGRKNYGIREYRILSALAPSLALDGDAEELPISVRPDSKVSVEEVMKQLGSWFEGTPSDLSARLLVPNPRYKDKEGNIVEGQSEKIVSTVANPWMRAEEVELFREMGDSAMVRIRTVSVPWCSYSTVIQLRSWLPDEVGGVAWISLDNPGESPRFPIFCGNTALPDLLSVCGSKAEREHAAIWHFRKANRLATVRWSQLRKILEPARDYFIEKGKRELPFVEKTWQEMNGSDPEAAQRMLDGYTADFFGAEVNKWEELERYFWRFLWGGF